MPACHAGGQGFEPPSGRHIYKFAGVAQSAEQLICNQQVDGSSPSTSSTDKHNMDGFPSGQRERTVNPLSQTTMVRIHPRPPNPSPRTAGVWIWEKPIICGHGGIGRRVRFRSVWGQPREGSSPFARTTISQALRGLFSCQIANRGRASVLRRWYTR